MDNIIQQIAEELSKTVTSVHPSEIEAIAQKIIKANRIFCAGCGRSGLIMRTLAMRFMHLGLHSHFVGEVTQPSIREGDLLIVGSSSGTTSSMVSIAKRSKGLHAEVVLLTSKPQSALMDIADAHVVIASRQIHSVQPDGNLFEQSLFVICDSIAIVVKDILHISEDVMDYNHTNLE